MLAAKTATERATAATMVAADAREAAEFSNRTGSILGELGVFWDWPEDARNDGDDNDLETANFGQQAFAMDVSDIELHGDACWRFVSRELKLN